MENTFSLVDITNDPRFSGLYDAGEGGNDFGSDLNTGTGFLDWSAFPGSSSFYTAGTQEGESGGIAPILNKQSLLDFLTKNNYNVGEASFGDTTARGIFDKSGKAISPIQYQNSNTWHDKLFMTLASMFLNPAGGIAAGGASGGVGGSMANSGGYSSAAAKGINAGLSGLMSSAGQGAEDGDILKAGATNALGAGAMPDIASYAGIEDPYLASAANGAIKNATVAYLNNGNVGEAATQGAVPGLASYLGDSMTTPSSSVPTTNAGQEPRNASFMASPLGEFLGSLVPQTPSGWGDLSQGLMQMYLAHRQRRDAKDMLGRLSGTRDAYGRQLRGSLAAQAAARGKRSNIGAREVELQARLADLDSRNAPMVSALQNNSLAGLFSMLQAGLQYGGKAGWFGDKYNPNVPQQPAKTAPILPSTMAQTPTNMNLAYDPYLGREKFKLGGM